MSKSEQTENMGQALEAVACELGKHSGPHPQVSTNERQRAKLGRALRTAALRYARAYYAEASELGLIPEYEQTGVPLETRAHEQARLARQVRSTAHRPRIAEQGARGRTMISQRRINWLRAQRLISITYAERSDLCRARLNSSRLGFVLRSPLTVEESGAQYDALIREVDERIRQLDTRLSYLEAYADRYAPDSVRRAG